MDNNKENVEVKKDDTHALEYEQLKSELAEANDTIKKYEDAYKELSVKYNRLYAMLGNQIEFALNLK
jgi:predicted transcriptional regulator